MKRFLASKTLRRWFAAGVIGALALPAAAQTLFDQSALLYNTNTQHGVNWQSQRGVPISNLEGTPAGSDGRNSMLPSAPTPHQFRGGVVYGGVTKRGNPIGVPSGPNFASNADALDWPRSKPEGQTTVLWVLRANVGAPYLSRQVASYYGSVIPLPPTDIDGNLLTTTTPSGYWFPEPFWPAVNSATLEHDGAPYYWSPHARTVFGVQAGNIEVTWRRLEALPNALNDPPAGYNPGVTHVLLGSSYYELHKIAYVVSGLPVKRPKKMYWTEGIYRATGKMVQVPDGRVKSLKFVFNDNFPEMVETNEIVQPYNLPITDQARRTISLQNGFITAYNKEGRVFMELLGDTVAGAARQHLGFEILDVYREAIPGDVTIDLGERISAFPDNTPSDFLLQPAPVNQSGTERFAYEHNMGSAGRVELYAIRETKNKNDYQVHWLEEGVEGLRWPFRFSRYRLVWPIDAAKYSHYVRPPAADENEAQLTAVSLPTDNAPTIEYQDPLDFVRGKLTQTFKFYTFLDATQPFHRTLIRFNAGDNIGFERVFSWLDQRLRSSASNDFSGTIASTLTAWDSTNGSLTFTNQFQGPRVINSTVEVGSRIPPPPSELGTQPDDGYWAGHIRDEIGTDYHAGAYLDPFSAGFEEASSTSIIPVNARPNQDKLEVWWFRKNAPDESKGFRPIYWPSVIGRYSIVWPVNASEIILASNDGSGGLVSLEAKGSVYYQNNSQAKGYNPNEEHALMLGGQAYALRDDLNITAGDGYTSEPYVLLQYVAADGRPSIRPFKVVRERPDLGITFEYSLNAGTILQAPMPLPLMDKPLVKRIFGEPPVSLNKEIGFWRVGTSANGTDGNETNKTALTTVGNHYFHNNQTLSLQDDSVPASPPVSKYFYTTNAPFGTETLEGFVSDYRPFELTYSGSDTNHTNQITFAIASTNGLTIGTNVVIFPRHGDTNWTVTIVSITGQDVLVEFAEEVDPEIAGLSDLLIVPAEVAEADFYADWRIATEALPAVPVDARSAFYASFTFQDRKGNVWIYRGPHDEQDDPSLQMQFYYRSVAGFYYPGQITQPPVGTITPYLRVTTAPGVYQGHPVFGDQNGDKEGDGNPLPITYKPVWPPNTPALHMAETLTLPKRGLPAMRGQTSLQILYQQSQAQPSDLESVKLHDATREKQFDLGPSDSTIKLGAIPDSIARTIYLGKTYFPTLPPHLTERFFLDPNRGENGALVFKGEFVDEALGDDYLLLNVLGAKDLAALKEICLADDPKKTAWDAAIDGLSTKMELFVENEARPGTFIASAGDAQDVGPGALAEVWDDDVAVDSYALTATGPAHGYVTLVSGNGLAFTPPGDPVSLHIVKVVDKLYRGELKVITAANPLSEKLTMQQVVDLAGKTEDYQFEWRIAAPIDGLPPVVYQNERQLLLGDGAWTHVRYPLPADSPGSVMNTAAARLSAEVTDRVVALHNVVFASSAVVLDNLEATLAAEQVHRLAAGNKVVVTDQAGKQEIGTVTAGTTAGKIVVSVPVPSTQGVDYTQIASIVEAPAAAGVPQSIVFRQFAIPKTNYSEVWLSVALDNFLGAKVYLDGALLATANLGENDTPPSSPPALMSPLSKAYRLPAAVLSNGTDGTDETTHVVAVELFSEAAVGALQNFNARLEAFVGADQTSADGTPWLVLAPEKHTDGVRAIIGEGADVQALADNYLIMRYGPTNNPAKWSQWTVPQLAEGWIKRVLAGINPFNQRVTDLFNNRVNTDASILSQAGGRWEGDVALNLENINSFGLIEIYETVLRRGKMLSVGAGINYGPANDALLLAAGYLNDLYMMVGNEAWADALNPTIGIGTKNQTYGDIATSLFSFKGQLASLLDEELALLRGRDDFLQPGVEVSPVYNRLIWNYTRGIDSGEAIYALNYNIIEDTDDGVDGVVNADDARKMYPQGHGDSYGHYLTALKGYYHLFMDTDFDWVPRTEAVLILGKPVQVDYLDERKFAAAGAAMARSGRQVFDLTWKKEYLPGKGNGWKHLSETRTNDRRATPVTRYWGTDHWATRVGQGSYINWVIGNAILPEVDEDPSHEGIQKIDRMTVPELRELAAGGVDLQVALDNAEAGMTPLGLPEDSLAFDINPNLVVGGEPKTHFEQIYDRAKIALQNALVAFDEAKDVTRMMRSEEDTLSEFRAKVAEQELAYTHKLVELYGSPYTDDIGPGKTYLTGYTGPDLLHYMYVDIAELTLPTWHDPSAAMEAKFDMQLFPPDYMQRLHTEWDEIVPQTGPIQEGIHYVAFTIEPHGFFGKPKTWTGRRGTPGRMQQAISEVIVARNKAAGLAIDVDWQKWVVDKSIQMFNFRRLNHDEIRDLERSKLIAQQVLKSAEFASDIVEKSIEISKKVTDLATDSIKEALPDVLIAGLAAGGDFSFPARAALMGAKTASLSTLEIVDYVRFFAIKALGFSVETSERWLDFEQIAPKQWDEEVKKEVIEIGNALSTLQGLVYPMNTSLQNLDDARRKVRALQAEGDRIQAEREVFRQRAAAVVQGYRTRDAAFRIFRNEKLERYKSLFDLASQYAFLAATAYDYETGLLHTEEGKQFVSRIISSRALGVVKNGEPQFAGSNTGDPGLSSALAEMKADWLVLKGRLGFNNPDAYGTTVSLRTENLRILPGTEGNEKWTDALHNARRANLLEDEDVRRYCMQIGGGNGLAVPGIVLEFSTTIADAHNLFGKPLAAGDHAYSVSSFATKVYAVGIALEGYVGMDNPSANAGAVGFAGGSTPVDPDLSFLDPNGLAATPYVYLVPVGEDAMRSPPLGDVSTVRTWSVQDVTVPLPFNIGASDFSSKQLYTSSDSLTEELFGIRKHQAFRPVSSASLFTPNIFSGSGGLAPSQFTNRRLIGRSVWNSKWKLVIPGHTLLNNPDEGLDRFIQTVKDVKLHFITYSYAGN